MQSFDEIFATDATKETTGIEFLMSPDGSPVGPGFLLARAGGANKKFDIVKERAYRQWRAKHGKKAEISEEQHIEIMIPVFAEAVIVGFFTLWIDESGNEQRRNEIQVTKDNWQPYSPKTAEDLLRKLPKSILIELMERSANFAAFKAEDLAGN